MPATVEKHSLADELHSKPDSTIVQRLLFSVGGMSCAACAGTITRALSDVDDFSNVTVHLMEQSLSLQAHPDMKEKVVELVEELGYECTFAAARLIKDPTIPVGENAPPRVIEIKVDNLACPRCPEVIMDALHPFEKEHNFEITRPLNLQSDTTFEVSYTPNPPAFALRDILSRIASTSCTSSHQSSFEASLYHPPTLESLSQAAQIRERKALLWRLILNIIIAVPTFLLGVVFTTLLPAQNSTRRYLESSMGSGTTSRAVWALFILATPVEFYCSSTFHVKAYKEISAIWSRRSKVPIWKRFIRFGSMNLLMSLGISVAYFSSVALLAMSSATPATGEESGMGTSYFDSVVFLSMFLLIGRNLEAYMRIRTADAVRSLSKIRPQFALLLKPLTALAEKSISSSFDSTPDIDNNFTPISKGTIVKQVPVDHLEVGDLIRVVSGGAASADGTVLASQSCSFDESMLTGESKPVIKLVGDTIFAGSICKSGSVDVKVDKLAGDTMLDRIVDSIREGQANHAEVERLADTLAGYFTPFVVFISLITWVIWFALGQSGRLPADYLDTGSGGWAVWSLRFAIAVFVIACPCGVGLAAPTAFMVGTGLGAKHGILIRGGGEAFEEADRVDIVCFDKTGTLTEGGDLKVDDAFFPSAIIPTPRILSMVKAAESASSHPLAKVLVNYCENTQAPDIEVTGFEEVAGRGVKARFGNTEALIGSETFISDHQLALRSAHTTQLDGWQNEAKSVVVVASREITEATYSLIAGFAISDALRKEAPATVERLKDLGVSVWMISGDNQVTCKAIARRVGIPENNVIAGVLPHEKAERVKWLQSTGPKQSQRKSQGTNARVAMCGDGINDAPALAVADISIAIGSGSDLAVSTSSFILLSCNLERILTLLDLSRTVMRRVKFNFLWAITYNMFALPIAAGVVYPAHHARLDPVWASLAMALSSISVLFSSLLLKLYRPPNPNPTSA